MGTACVQSVIHIRTPTVLLDLVGLQDKDNLPFVGSFCCTAPWLSDNERILARIRISRSITCQMTISNRLFNKFCYRNDTLHIPAALRVTSQHIPEPAPLSGSQPGPSQSIYMPATYVVGNRVSSAFRVRRGKIAGLHTLHCIPLSIVQNELELQKPI